MSEVLEKFMQITSDDVALIVRRIYLVSLGLLLLCQCGARESAYSVVEFLITPAMLKTIEALAECSAVSLRVSSIVALACLIPLCLFEKKKSLPGWSLSEGAIRLGLWFQFHISPRVAIWLLCSAEIACSLFNVNEAFNLGAINADGVGFLRSISSILNLFLLGAICSLSYQRYRLVIPNEFAG